MIKSPLIDSGFVVPIVFPGDDPITCLNKAMAFLIAIAFLRLPSTNNQLRTSLNLRNQATIQDGRVTVQQLQRRQGQSYSGTGYKSNATSSGENKASRQTRVVKCYNYQALLAEAQEAGQILDEKQLVFLADPGVPDGQVVQTIIPNNAAFQTEDLDTYDSDCNDISNAQGFPWPTFLTMVLTSFQSREKLIDSQMDDMIREKRALKEQVNSLEQNLSKQIKEKGCLLQTFTVLKNESKENKDKYMENENDLEKKIKKLDNILFKVGQSAQTVHMLTKPQAFYDNIHKQALGYQNSFLLRKTQRIKPTLYDGIIMSDNHVAMIVIDDEGTLILEENNFLNILGNVLLHNKKWMMNKRSGSVYQSTNKPYDASPVTIKAPKELPKVSLVNESLKKLKFHLAKFDNVVKIKTTPDARTEAQLQDKDSTICKLKDIIKSMREKSKDKNVNYDYVEVETKNVELENSVAKLTTENERLSNEINHVKRVFKEQFDSIKRTCVVQIVLWYMDSECSKHITGNCSQLMNFVSKFLGTVRFENDHIAKIMRYVDYQLGNITITRVYYVKGLRHNLFSVGQFCDTDHEVAFRKNTYFIRNLEGVDLISGSRDTNLYIISLDDMLKTSQICLLSKALKTKSWLWHRRLSHLNFGSLNTLAKDGLARGIPRLKFQKDHLCCACALGKRNKSSHQPKAEDTNQEKLYPLHMDLCGPMRVASIYEKRDDWDHLFQRMFDEYFNPPTIVVSLVLVVVAPRAADLAYSPVSTSIDHDASSSSTPSSQEQEHSLIISQGFKESPKTPLFNNDPLNESPHEELTSQGSSSNMRQIHTPFKH
nr:integrase, catalytic region, zinc finger, CCHC-type, peptidase aspartic, catalytic [Tanacetum cinerariifolium]